MDKKFFFDRYGLAQADVERYLAAALSAGGDYADLYFEYQTSTSVSLDESMVKSATAGNLRRLRRARPVRRAHRVRLH